MSMCSLWTNTSVLQIIWRPLMAGDRWNPAPTAVGAGMFQSLIVVRNVRSLARPSFVIRIHESTYEGVEGHAGVGNRQATSGGI